MTETLLQKLEEKTMNLLSELEKLRSELKQAKHDNFALRTEKDNNTRKLQDLMSLLDSTPSESPSLYLQEDAVNAA